MPRPQVSSESLLEEGTDLIIQLFDSSEKQRDASLEKIYNLYQMADSTLLKEYVDGLQEENAKQENKKKPVSIKSRSSNIDQLIALKNLDDQGKKAIAILSLNSEKKGEQDSQLLYLQSLYLEANNVGDNIDFRSQVDTLVKEANEYLAELKAKYSRELDNLFPARIYLSDADQELFDTLIFQAFEIIISIDFDTFVIGKEPLKDAFACINTLIQNNQEVEEKHQIGIEIPSITTQQKRTPTTPSLFPFPQTLSAVSVSPVRAAPIGIKMLTINDTGDATASSATSPSSRTPR